MRTNNEAIYVLKNECLKKDAKEHVIYVEGDLEEIWRRFGDSFGRSELAARAFLLISFTSDLRQITLVAEGDTAKFIRLDTVGRGSGKNQKSQMRL